MPSFWERLKRSWNVFTDSEERLPMNYPYYGGSSMRPDRSYAPFSNPKTIVQTIQNKIAVDCASIRMNHVKVNDENQFEEVIYDELNRVLSFEANIDQTGSELIQDAVMSMFQDGVVAIVPIEYDGGSVWRSRTFKVLTARVGKIVEWFPDRIRVDIYNDRTGRHQQIVVPKSAAVIVQNPFYEIMNARNSTVDRLRRLIAQLESSNDQVSSDKIDLIVQLPYSLKSEAKQVQAEHRRKDIEAQLVNSKYGIAYIDATEHVTQLNRSLENNLWNQVKDLTQQVYNELGLTQSIFDGTANEQTLLDYYNRTIDPIMSRIAQNIERKWLSDTARTQHHAVQYFRDPFKLVPVNNIAEIADKFTRNEIMSSNEIRAVVGLKPSKDPKADQLVNANLNQAKEEQPTAEQVQDFKMEGNQEDKQLIDDLLSRNPNLGL